MTDIYTYGYDTHVQDAFTDLNLTDCIVGRVIADYGGFLRVVTPAEYDAELTGALLHTSEPFMLPKVGDWVAIEISQSGRSSIKAVIPRHSEISRKAAGTGNNRQVLATNVDIAFVVQSLDQDFSPARLERYSYQLSESNIRPIFIFNKADKAYDIDEKLEHIDRLTMPYIVTTATSGKGIQSIKDLISDGKSAVFLGSSGVGKSTLTNALLGVDRQKTAVVRASDSTGKHTTSHRELFVLPSGGMIIDTPGIRELQLWGEEEFLSKSFADIEHYANQCEFSNCSHIKEVNCAVKVAVAVGEIPAIRLESYLKFKNELQTQAFIRASQSAKEKKQRAHRAKKAIQLDEKLHDDSELY
jgi:ribosome biogenesis GTPase